MNCLFWHPASDLNRLFSVTGLSKWISIMGIGLICTVYTAIVSHHINTYIISDIFDNSHFSFHSGWHAHSGVHRLYTSGYYLHGNAHVDNIWNR